MNPRHQKLYRALKLTRNDIACVVDGGLFNDVHCVIKAGEHFYIKSFSDQAKALSFPPLPTTALQRYEIAVALHEQAQTVVTSNVYVPRLMAVDLENRAIAMEGAKGIYLFEYMVNQATFSLAVERVAHVLIWLKSFHELKNSNTPILKINSEAFKRYKTILQYQKSFEFLQSKNLEEANAFLNEHLTIEETLLHGDLNSRNIIICEDGRIAIIDFEQGQLGCGTHDAAYLISEIVIAASVIDEDIEAVINLLWHCYEIDTRNITKYRRFRRHLSFQVLYRLKGPSQAIWTGHLNDKVKANIDAWCAQEFSSRL